MKNAKTLFSMLLSFILVLSFIPSFGIAYAYSEDMSDDARELADSDTGVEAKSTGSTTANVSWACVSHATGYEIYQATTKTGKYKAIAKVFGTSESSYKVTGLTCGKTYYFKVRAFLDEGFAFTYSQMPLEPAKVTPKPAKVVAAAASVSKTSLKLTWGKIAGASGYEIVRATSKGGKYTKIKTVTKGSTVAFTNKKLKPNKSYYYKVRAYKNVSGKKVYGAYSSIVSAKTISASQ